MDRRRLRQGGARPALAAVLVAALAAVLAAGCCRPPRPDILLISLDTLRADSLGSYGYRHDTTPFLDEMAARGVRLSLIHI